MSIAMIEVIRGSIVECVHNGNAVVVDATGKLIYYAGNPYRHTYFRSAAKPIQALQVVLSGAYTHFGLTESELAVICSSHYAEEYHIEAVRSILHKIGLDESYLQCGAAVSLKPEVALKTALSGIGKMPIMSDCSGKHSGMLAVCKKMGYDLSSYLDPMHPLQQRILSSLHEISNYPMEKIGIGIDGCSVPVFALPIYNMALAYARIADVQSLPEKYQSAASIIFEAMNDYPEYIAGRDGFCTNLIKSGEGQLIGKIGAEGVYCIGLKEFGLGIAVKVEDGNSRAIPPIVMQILQTIDVLKPEIIQSLHQYINPLLTNDAGMTVGYMHPVFKLIKNAK